MISHHRDDAVARAEPRQRCGDVVMERGAARHVIAGERHEVDVESVGARDPPLRMTSWAEASDVEIGELRDSIPFERSAESGHGDLEGADAGPAPPHHHSIEGEGERGEVRDDGEVAEVCGDGAVGAARAVKEEEMTSGDHQRAEDEERRAHHRGAPVNVEWLFDEVEPPAREGRIHPRAGDAAAQQRARMRGQGNPFQCLQQSDDEQSDDQSDDEQSDEQSGDEQSGDEQSGDEQSGDQSADERREEKEEKTTAGNCETSARSRARVLVEA